MDMHLVMEQRERMRSLFSKMGQEGDILLNRLEHLLKTGMDPQFLYEDGYSPVGLLIQYPVHHSIKILAFDSLVLAGVNPLLLDCPLRKIIEKDSWVLETTASLAQHGFEYHDEDGNNLLHLAMTTEQGIKQARMAFDLYFERSPSGAPPLDTHQGLHKLVSHHRHMDGLSPLAVMLFHTPAPAVQHQATNRARLTHYMVASGASLAETNPEGITAAENFIALLGHDTHHLKKYPGCWD
jgi:hypothetical protein